MVELSWLVGAQVLTAGWVASSCRAHGVQLLAPALDQRLPRGKADALTALGRASVQPHEVWLLGLLLTLGLSAPGLVTYVVGPLWPVAAVLAGGAVVTSVGTRVRRWPRTGTGRRVMAVLTSVSALITLTTTGYAGALLITGDGLSSINGETTTTTARWFAALCGITWVAIAAAGGSAHIDRHQVGDIAHRARALRTPLLGLGAGLVVTCLAMATTTHQISPVLHRSVLWAGAITVIGVLGAAITTAALGRGHWIATLSTAAAVIPPLLLGAAAWPYIVVSRHPESSLRVAAVLAQHPFLARTTALLMTVASLVMLWRAWTLAEGGLEHAIRRLRPQSRPRPRRARPSHLGHR